ncbi:MAG: DnaJ domain-containing protein [Ahrensia sp.]|nr:DnaJ domain-containing protein [Ahrensia sp.]
MHDPYAVLGVSKDADEKQIKSAFRKLAKRFHPDQNKDNPKAKERFAEVNAAYEIVGDKTKRRQFDNGEIDAEGKERFQGFAGGNPFEGMRRGGGGGQFTGAEDILSQMFGQMGGGGDPFGRAGGGFAGAGMGGSGMGGGRARAGQGGPPKGEDRKIALTVHLKDLALGKAPVRLGTDRTVNVTIPPEPDDGQVVRLKGQGKEGPAGPGDALIALSIAPHSQFQREGANLRTHVPVDLRTAVLGGKIRVPTLTGAVALTIPEWSSSGDVFRVRGKGLPARSGGHGDILAVLSLRLPDEKDQALIDLFAQEEPTAA